MYACVPQIIEKTQLAKEFGFKILAHIMPDLPGSSPELDKAVIDDVSVPLLLTFGST